MEIIPDPMHVVALSLPFLVAMVGAHLILWRPLLQWLDERDQTRDQALKQADELSGAADEQLERLHKRLAEANAHVGGLRAEARGRALAAEGKIVAAARTEADRKLGDAVGVIATQRDAASQTLKDTAQELSADIAGQVLGRSVA